MISPVPNVYIIDASNQQWQLSVGNGGEPINTVPVSGQVAVPFIIINDVSLSNPQTWEFTIVPDPSPYPGASPGDLHIAPVAEQTGAPLQIQVNSPDGTLWWLQINGGFLQTVEGTGQCTPVVGSLYAQPWNNIAWSQPSGVGGLVYPQQNTGSFGYPGDQIRMQEPGQGLWTSGCGHWWSCMSVQKDYNYCTQQNCAVFLCPVCGYVIKTVTPYELIDDPIAYMILIP